MDTSIGLVGTSRSSLCRKSDTIGVHKTKFITQGDLNSHPWQKKISWQYGFGSFLLSLMLTGPTLTSFGQTNPALLAHTICSVVPLFLCIYVGLKWPNDLKLFDFRFRCFFPDLASCFPPFVFGCELGGDIMCALIAAGLVLFPWLLGIVLPTKRFAQPALRF